jgi:hypothetical protein
MASHLSSSAPSPARPCARRRPPLRGCSGYVSPPSVVSIHLPALETPFVSLHLTMSFAGLHLLPRCSLHLPAPSADGAPHDALSVFYAQAKWGKSGLAAACMRRRCG